MSLIKKYKKEFPKGTPIVVACEKGRLEDQLKIFRRQLKRFFNFLTYIYYINT